MLPYMRLIVTHRLWDGLGGHIKELSTIFTTNMTVKHRLRPHVAKEALKSM